MIISLSVELIMTHKYDHIIDEMAARCEVLGADQTREECCEEKGMTNCPPLTQNAFTTNYVKIEEQSTLYPTPFLAASLVLACTFLYLAVRKKWPQRAWGRLGEQAKAIVSGWAVWLVIVFSYILIIEPYSYGMSSVDHTNILMWLSLPPLCAIAVFLWVKRFIQWRK